MQSVYFVADDGTHGRELWRRKPDGTVALVMDINPGAAGSDAGGTAGLIRFGGAIYFSANDPTNGAGLWRVNADETVTRVDLGGPTTDIGASGGFREANGALYFFAGIDGTSTLMRIAADGVAQAVSQASPLANAFAFSSDQFITFGGNLHVVATATEGTGFYKISGEPATLTFVAALDQGAGDMANLASFAELNGALYFTALDDVNGNEVRRLNADGTIDTFDLTPGPGGSIPSSEIGRLGFTEHGGDLYYIATNPLADGLQQLHRINGSTGEPELVAAAMDVRLTNRSMAASANGLYFVGYTDTGGAELYRLANDALVTFDIAPGGGTDFDGNFVPNSSSPANLRLFGGSLFFTATTPDAGTELWRLTDTPGATPEIVADIFAGPDGSYPGPFELDGKLFFIAQLGIGAQGQAVTALYSVTPSGAPTLVYQFGDQAFPADFKVIDNALYFSANDPATGFELHRISATGQHELVADLNSARAISVVSNAVDLNGDLYFYASDAVSGLQLWKATSSGVEKVEDGRTGPASSGEYSSGGVDRSPVVFDNTLYFAGATTATGQELCRIGADGRIETVADLAPDGGSNPQFFKVYGNSLYFNAYDPVAGYELRRVEAGSSTISTIDIAPGPNSSIAGSYANGGVSFVEFNSSLYFMAAPTGSLTYRIYQLNTAGDGADQVATTGIPQSQLSGIDGFKVAGDDLYFTAFYIQPGNVRHGTELFRLTANNTIQFAGDIGPGNQSSNADVRSFTDFNGTLYFTATNAATGNELWRVNDATGIAELVIDINPGGFNSFANNLTVFDGGLYFSAINEIGQFLYRVDGQGTVAPVDNTLFGPGSYGGLKVFNGSLYFSANDLASGLELRRIDAGSTTVHLVADLAVGAGSSNAGSSAGFVEFNGGLYFSASNGAAQFFWRVNADQTVTQVASAPTDSFMTLLGVTGDRIYYASDFTHIVSLDTAGVLRTETGTPNGGSDPRFFTGLESANSTNHQPVAGNDDGNAILVSAGLPAPAEDNAVTFSAAQLLANDTDPDAGETALLKIASVSGAAHGTLSTSANTDGSIATVTFTPDANYNGSASFTYTIHDPNGAPSTATVSLTFAAVNDVPVAIGDSAAVSEDTDLAASVGTNDIRGDGANVFAVATGPSNGSLVAFNSSTGFYTYRPNANFNGSDSFTYSLTDADGDVSTATANITINPIDDESLARNDFRAVNEDTLLTGSVAINDTPVLDGDNRFALGTAALHGTAMVNTDGSFSYRPNINFNGFDSFTYALTDVDGDVSTATVSVLVYNVDDVTAAHDDAVAVLSDTQLTGSVASNDTLAADGGEVFTLNTQAQHGTASVNADGTFSYMPNLNYYGGDSFSYRLTDVDGDITAATVNVTVNPVGDVPVATRDTGTVFRNGVLHSSLAVNDTLSADGGNIFSLQAAAANGTVSINPQTGAYTYTPNVGFTGTDNFTYALTDVDGEASVATVSVATYLHNNAPTFFAGGDGKVIEGFVRTFVINGQTLTFEADDRSFSHSVDSLGRVVLAGYSSTSSATPGGPFALMRLDADGKLDATFGDGGRVLTALSGFSRAYDVVHQPDGKIVVVGEAGSFGNDFVAIRYNSDGSLDTSFGVAGIVTTSLHTSNDGARGVIVQPDGKIVVAGTISPEIGDFIVTVLPRDIGLVRYNPDGSLDLTFGSGGKVITSLGSQFSETADAIALQADGAILVVGTGQPTIADADAGRSAIYRYGLHGVLDPTFGSPSPGVPGGYVFLPASAEFDATGIKVQNDGKILLSGTIGTSGSAGQDFGLMRLNADGHTDTSFGLNGIVKTVVGADYDAANSVVIQSDGKILVGGYSTQVGSYIDFAIVRYNSDGSLDTSFGDAGIVTTPIGPGPAIDYGYDLTALPDGRIVLSGYSHIAGHFGGDFSVARYNPDGTLDLTFDAVNTLNATPVIVENSGIAVPLDTTVQVRDVELASFNNYDGASLLVSRNGGANPSDTFAFAGGPVAPVVVDGNLILGGVAIGAVVQGGGSLLITFNANATQALVNQALSGITFFNPSDVFPLGTTTLHLAWAFSDGDVNDPRIATQLLAVTVIGNNDAPVAVADFAAAMEDAAVVTGTVAANDSDIDDGAVLSYALDAAVAGLALASDGNFAFDPSHAAYQYLAESETTDVIAHYTVTDEHGAAAPATLTITLTGTNDVPVVAATDVTGAVTELVAPTGNLTDSGTIAFTDVDLTDAHNISAVTASGGALGSLTASVTADSTGSGLGGVVTWNYSVPAGAVEYLAAGQTKDETFTFNVLDGNGGSVPRTVTITLIGTNDDVTVTASVAAGTVVEDTTASAAGSIAFTDVDLRDDHTASFAPVAGQTTLGTFALGTVSEAANAAGGTVGWSYTINDAAAQYLAENQSVTETFIVTLDDGNGDSVTQNVVVTIIGTNDGPVAVADTNAGNEDATITGSVASNDSDIDNGAILTYTLNAPVAGLTLGTNGGYSFDAGNAAYQHLALGTIANVVAHYTVTDEHNATANATLTITISGTNDAPVAVGPATLAATEDTDANGQVVASDIDGDVLSYALKAGAAPLKGTVTFGADGAFLYRPNANANGADSFTVAVSDGKGGVAEQTVSVTIVAVNDQPVAVIDAVTTNEDTGVAVNVVANDSDVDGDAIQLLSATALHGTVTVSGGIVTYSPNANYNGADTVTYQISDGNGGAATGTLAVTVTPVNDAPVAVADTAMTAEDTGVTLQASTLLANDYDVDGDALTIVSVQGAVGGSVALNGSGNVVFTPTGNFNGPASFTYTVRDAAGDTATATVAVTVTPVNDAATINGSANGTTTASVTEDAAPNVVGGALTIVDPDVGQSVFQTPASVAGTYGAFAFNAGTGAWTYTLDNARPATQALNSGQTAHDTLTVKSLDGTATHTIDVGVLGQNEVTVNHPGTGGVTIASAVDNGNTTATLTAANSIADSDGIIGPIRYQWQSQATTTSPWIDIAGAAAKLATFTTTSAQAGQLLRVTASYTDPFGSVTLTSAETAIVGSNAGNTLTGTSSKNFILGLAGNDTIVGFAGADVVNGGAGNDTIRLAATSLDLNAASDAQIVNVEIVSAASATAGVSIDLHNQAEGFTITGGGSDDTIRGSKGADVINAGAGDDTILGFAGADTVNGGGGTDTIVLSATSDDLNGAANTQITGVQAISAASATAGVTIDLHNQLEGFTITGSTFADMLTGGDGNDRFDAGTGNDALVGGLGTDTAVFAAAAGAASFSLGTGLNAAVSVTTAVDGTDSLFGIERFQFAGVTYTVLFGDNGDNSGSQSLNGTGANDLIVGFGGADTLVGNAGSDWLDGGAGVDNLRGGTGRDILAGGGGADTFVFATAAEAGNGAANRDVIIDFVAGVDKIDLSAIDADTRGGNAAAGDQAFIWVDTPGTAASPPLSGQQLGYHYETDAQGNDHTIVDGNIRSSTTDASINFQIDLLGHVVLHETDFRL